MSHTLPETWADDRGVRRSLDVVERITGCRPTTCPWRALYHPIMGEVLGLHLAWDEGNVPAFLGDDDPAVLHDALRTYRAMVLAVRGEQMKLRAARDKAKRQH